VVSGTDVPFGDLTDDQLRFGSPKTEFFEEWIGISSQIWKKIKSTYLQNYVSNLHKIWQADVIIIIIIIIKNKKIRVTLCENAAGALYIVNNVAQREDFMGGPVWWCNNSKMADNCHLGFQFMAIIWASIKIFAPNLVQWWKINSARWCVGQ